MKFLLLAVLTVSSFSAFSKDCSQLSATYDLKVCESENLDEQDKRLNVVYGQLMKKLDNVAQAKLKKSQRAWIAFRDANCEFSGDEMRGGTMEGLVILGCLSNTTKERADELKDYVDFR